MLRGITLASAPPVGNAKVDLGVALAGRDLLAIAVGQPHDARASHHVTLPSRFAA